MRSGILGWTIIALMSWLLSNEEHTFTSTDYLTKTSEWALYQSKERIWSQAVKISQEQNWQFGGSWVQVQWFRLQIRREVCRGYWRGCCISLSCVILNVYLIFIFHYLYSICRRALVWPLQTLQSNRTIWNSSLELRRK